MLRLKGDQDLRIEITHGFAVAIGQIDSARGQADVIEDAAQFRRWNHLPNHVLRLAGDTSRLLDASAGLGAQMEAQLAGIDRGKEVLTQMSDERKTPQAEDQKTAGEERPVIQTELQQVRVTSLDGVKAALEAVMNSRENAV